MPQNPSIAQKLRANLAALREQGAPRERIEEELVRWQGKLNEQSAADPERQRSTMDNIGAGAQAFSDAATFGLSGLADDALSGGSFSENRAFRRENKNAMPQGARFAAEIAGAVASPIGSVGTAARALKAAKTLQEARGAANLVKVGGTLVPQAARSAGFGARTGRVMADAAAQSGIAGTVNNLDEVSGEGVKTALVEGAKAAGMGAGFGGTVGAISGGVARTASRAKDLKHLGKVADDISQRTKQLDQVGYPRAAAEGVGKKFQYADEALLSRPDTKAVIDELRKSRQFADADDATILREAHKLLTDVEGQKIGTLQRADGFRANTNFDKGEVALAKEDVMKVADNMMPSLRGANANHAAGMRELESLQMGADVGGGVIAGKAVRGKKLLSQSKEALTRKILDTTPGKAMSPADLEAVRAGIIARAGEAAHMTSNPLTGFNLVPAAVRIPLAAYRGGPVLEALEQRLGRGTLGQPTADMTRGTLARLFGARQGNNR